MKQFFKFILFFMLIISDLEFAKAQNINFIPIEINEVELSEPYINGNLYQKDLLLFFEMIRGTHLAFTSNATPSFDLNKTITSGYEWAKDCNSTQELWVYLQSIISTLNDGHTSLLPDYNNSLIFPFMFVKFDGGYYLYTVTRNYSSSLGKQIVNINDAPIEEVIQSFRPLFSCENEVGFQQKIKNQISFEILWANNKYKSKDSNLHLTFTDGTSISILPTTANNRDLVVMQTERDPQSVRQYSNDLFRYQIFNDHKICYLQFNVCEDQNTLRLKLLNNDKGLTPTQIEQVLAKYPRFDLFLSKMFAEIAENGIKTLVVDVRDNSGGNSILCDILLSWLKPFDTITTTTSKMRISHLWEANFPQVANDYREAFGKKGMQYQYGAIYDDQVITDILISEDGCYKIYGIDLNELFVKNQDRNKVFGGDVIFIQNENTYSSAGLLITTASDNNIGLVIGTDSAFKPCHYGDILGWMLPNTRITGFVSHKYFQRPASYKCNASSIEPKVVIQYQLDDFISGKDVYWNWILDNYGYK